MSYSDYLKNTLKPLGIYELDTGIGSAELNALGAIMDEVEEKLSKTYREMLPMTAEDEGLRKFEGLFPGAASTEDTAARRTAVNALMRLREYDCSDQGLNILLSDCGIPASVYETDTKEVLNVRFSGIQPEGEELKRLKQRIEAILPCHLEVIYE
ncbi:MAG: hypothetical protein Q4A83_01060 [Bacillota bacterium]|nr:hypothetical protein [Bacillota bacterium]